MNTKYKLILLAGILLFSTKIYPQQKQMNKSFHKTFPTNENIILLIRNTKGDILIENWKKNSIEVNIEIKASSSSQERVKQLLNFVNIEFSRTDTSINIFTLINKKKSLLDFLKLHKRDTLKINYFIKMPVYQKLNLKNTFGNIKINEIHGHSNIILKYGYFEAKRLCFENTKPLSKIQLAFSDGYITYCSTVEFILSYSTVSIDKSISIIVHSRYSNLNIEHSRALVSKSKFDKYKIGEAGYFNTNADFSEFKIANLSRKLEFDIKYSNLRIANVLPTLKSINYTGKYSDAVIQIPSELSYKLFAKIKFGNISFSENNKLKVTKSYISEKYEGLIGSDINTDTEVNIYCEFGNVVLK